MCISLATKYTDLLGPLSIAWRTTTSIAHGDKYRQIPLRSRYNTIFMLIAINRISHRAIEKHLYQRSIRVYVCSQCIYRSMCVYFHCLVAQSFCRKTIIDRRRRRQFRRIRRRNWCRCSACRNQDDRMYSVLILFYC